MGNFRRRNWIDLLWCLCWYKDHAKNYYQQGEDQTGEQEKEILIMQADFKEGIATRYRIVNWNVHQVWQPSHKGDKEYWCALLETTSATIQLWLSGKRKTEKRINKFDI